MITVFVSYLLYITGALEALTKKKKKEIRIMKGSKLND